METNWNQLIERYLNNELSAEGKAAFETELQQNTELQKEFELHKLTQELIQRNSLRTLVKQSGKWFHLKKILVNSGIALVIAGALATAIYVAATWSESTNLEKEEVLEQSTLDKLNKYLAFENIDPEYFKFTGESDVFLSESGVLMSITDQSFLLDGKPYKGEAIVQWQEAQKGSDIVKAGLSTTSGDKLLETQGMFSLKAFTPNGKPLDLSDVGVYVQVPVDEVKEGMKLFQGVKGKNGQIDWQNPKELERLPQVKDMSKMDLFPPKYEPQLNELKWFTEKAKRDSLYLSFEEGNESDDKQIVNGGPSNSQERPNEKKTATKIINPVLNAEGKYEIDNPQYTFVDHPSATRSAMGTVGLSRGDVYDFRLVWSMLDDDHVRLLVYGKINSNRQLLAHTSGDLLGLEGDYPKLKFVELKSEQVLMNGYIELAAVYDIELKEKGELSQDGVLYLKMSNNNVLSQKFDIEFVKREPSKRPVKDSIVDKNHIPPSKVLAIWNKKFNNTNLATQDFEDRMKAIHETCNEKVFDAYAKNLNEPLWKLDQRVVAMGYPEFQQFADQKVGAVQINNVHQKNLDAFYEKAIETIRETGRKNFEAALNKEHQWDDELQDERKGEVLRKGLRESTNLNEEAEFNLRNIGFQLGKKVGFSLNKNTFPVTGSRSEKSNMISGPMVVNIDRLTRSLLSSRQNIVVKDSKTNKQTKVEYSAIKITVAEAQNFDHLFCYLFPNKLNSYQRLDFQQGSINYTLNNDLTYKAILFAQNEDGFYWYEFEKLNPGEYPDKNLKRVSETEFENRMNELDSQRSPKNISLNQELNWLFKEQSNYKVIKQRQKNEAFRNQVRPTIYSCLSQEVANSGPGGAQSVIRESYTGNQVDPTDVFDVPPSFPGGISALRIFLNENVEFPQVMYDKTINGNVHIKFIVDKKGNVSNVTIKKGIPNCPECDQEGLRVVKKLPPFIPASMNGKNVASSYSIPISFKSN